MTIQVLTPHQIEVIISEKNITSAVIDGEWDELSQQLIPKEPDTDGPNNTTGTNAEGKFVEIKYNVTVEKASWDKWYEEENTQFIKEPTPSELIFVY